jgi:hypothetical protein
MHKMMKWLVALLALVGWSHVSAQPDRWQQRIAYNIDVRMNVNTNQFTGIEKIEYWNNSPDTLNRIFFHTYWNAFQPGSMMDVRSRELGKILLGYDKDGNTVYDWDEKIKDRILHLQPNEIGYDTVDYVKINGSNQKLIYHETILEVQLKSPLLPRSKTSMEVSFHSQVPLQIRRSGRDNAQGVRYSISQWYPKMVEYDYQGWNANPYIQREFYGVWGDFNVNITIDRSYILGATGTLQNPDQVGFGYETSSAPVRSVAGNTLTWKFSAQNVHDFVWAADTSFTVVKRQIANGPLLYFVYKKSPAADADWKALSDTIVKAYPFIAKNFGAYPYKNYSYIQGGDGYMEYPMATLMKRASIGSGIHEFMHSWYYGIIGTNESLYPWMDEGFATYAELRISAYLRGDTSFPFTNSYTSYFRLVKSGKEEALSTPADHYNTNFAYDAPYSKGSIFLVQLAYIVGQKNLDNILLEYYNEWKFKHPNPNDFIRVAEKVTGLELQWYKQYWIYTTRTIDYAIGDINMSSDTTLVTLKRLGLMSMPVDVLITYKDSTKEMYYIPMNLMYGAKPPEDNTKRIVEPEWKWVDPDYTFHITRSVADIKSVEIDPSQRMADMNRVNNKITVP